MTSPPVVVLVYLNTIELRNLDVIVISRVRGMYGIYCTEAQGRINIRVTVTFCLQLARP